MRIDAIVIKGMADDEFPGGGVVVVCFNVGGQLGVNSEQSGRWRAMRDRNYIQGWDWSAQWLMRANVGIDIMAELFW